MPVKQRRNLLLKIVCCFNVSNNILYILLYVFQSKKLDSYKEKKSEEAKEIL